MALSTYWVSRRRKDLVEQAIVAKREREAAHTKKCQEAASFHQELARKSTKYKYLEEAKTLRTPRMQEESYVLQDQKAAAKEKLELRRQKLAHMLDIENNQYMKELEDLKDKNRDRDPYSISEIKGRIEKLQRERKENEQNMQKRYNRHVFASSANSYLKEEESEILEKEVAEAWQERKRELEKLQLERLQKEQEELKQLQTEKSEAARDANEIETLHLKEQEIWSDVVESKINELKAADCDSKKLQTEKGILVDHLETLLSLKRRRDAMKEIQKKAYQKIQNLWQPNEKMRKMLNEVKHGLEFDYKMLSTVMDLNNSLSENTALAYIDLDEVAVVKEKVEMQIALERERELEILQLYQEEASRIWDDKKDKWMMESEVRDEIINELIKSVVSQISKKVESNACEEKRLISLKENILEEVDSINMKVKNNCKTLESKHRYYVDQVDKLDGMLQSKMSLERPVES